jgi:hypothetical protein
MYGAVGGGAHSDVHFSQASQLEYPPLDCPTGMYLRLRVHGGTRGLRGGDGVHEQIEQEKHARRVPFHSPDVKEHALIFWANVAEQSGAPDT